MEEKLNAYPLKFEPNLKTVIWGGGKIRKLKKLADAPDCIGESWELTGVPGQESVVSNGEYAGRDIKSLLGEFGAQVVGLNTYNKYGDMFPIMVKFIDAAKDLSIQVHPDDDFATMEGLITAETWPAFAPELPSDVIYNIIYGQKYTESDHKIFVLRGIANGFEIELTFVRKNNKWLLEKMVN